MIRPGGKERRTGSQAERWDIEGVMVKSCMYALVCVYK